MKRRYSFYKVVKWTVTSRYVSVYKNTHEMTRAEAIAEAGRRNKEYGLKVWRAVAILNDGRIVNEKEVIIKDEVSGLQDCG